MMTALIWAAAVLAVTSTICWAGLKAWRSWLDFRRFEVSAGQNPDRGRPEPSPATRIEIADLRERLRKLEAIATGVDL